MSVAQWIVGSLLLLSALVMIVTVLLQSGSRTGLGAISGAAETFFGKSKAKGMDAKAGADYQNLHRPVRDAEPCDDAFRLIPSRNQNSLPHAGGCF